MNRILLDTNIVSYWHNGEARFKLPLQKLFRELGKHDAAIVGTAAHHGLDMVVTTDRVLVTRYGELFDEIRTIEPTE